MDVVMDLYDYTTTIIANENIFNRTCSSLINRIDQEVSIIYHYCRSANEDYDNRKKDEAEIRIKMEEEAIKQCKWLKTDIRLAQRKFHLGGRSHKTVQVAEDRHSSRAKEIPPARKKDDLLERPSK